MNLRISNNNYAQLNNLLTRVRTNAKKLKALNKY